MHEIRSRKVRRILRREARAAALQRRHEAAVSRAARFTARELELRQAARDIETTLTGTQLGQLRRARGESP